PVVGGERHAVLQLSALQEQGVDSFLITQGEMAGQLSLGVFQRQDHAELRREQLQAQGHDAHVHALSRRERQYVVEVGGASRRLARDKLDRCWGVNTFKLRVFLRKVLTEARQVMKMPPLVRRGSRAVKGIRL